MQKLSIRVCCVTLPKISDFSHEICKFRRAAQWKVSSFSLIFSLSSDRLSFLAHGWHSHSWGFWGTRMAITHSRTLSPTSPPENRFCPQGILPLFLTGFRGVLERRKFDLYTHGVMWASLRPKAGRKCFFILSLNKIFLRGVKTESKSELKKTRSDYRASKHFKNGDDNRTCRGL